VTKRKRLPDGSRNVLISLIGARGFEHPTSRFQTKSPGSIWQKALIETQARINRKIEDTGVPCRSFWPRKATAAQGYLGRS
jgi:hypothetical protein